MNQLKIQKVILITGCSSGFGLLTAARLAAKGERVFATMRDAAKKQALLDEVKRRGGSVEVLQLDVTDVPSVRAAVEAIRKSAGRVDVLINNAGYGVGGFFEDLTQEEIRAQMETNFFGVQNTIREILPLMRAQKNGTIINITSVAGLYAAPAFNAYNASKWALEGFSESLYYELKPFGIRVCAIEPGTYNTTIFHANKRYAARFSDPQSPYFEFSQHLDKKVMDFVAKTRRDPERVAQLIEKIIESGNPAFRNFPDMQARAVFFVKKILPFRVFSWLIYNLLYSGLPRKET